MSCLDGWCYINAKPLFIILTSLCFNVWLDFVLIVSVPFPLLYMIPFLFRFKLILSCVWTFSSVCYLILLNVVVISITVAFALVSIKYGFWHQLFCWLFYCWVVAYFASVFVCLVFDHWKEALTWVKFKDLACEYIILAVKLGTLESKSKLKFKLQKNSSGSWLYWSIANVFKNSDLLLLPWIYLKILLQYISISHCVYQQCFLFHTEIQGCF